MFAHSITVMRLFAPHGQGMSHNGRTLSHVTERRTGVRLPSAVSPAADAGMWLFTEHFGNDVQLNIPQCVRQNKTASLVMQRGAGPDGG